MCGDLFGKKSAKRQADATLKAAADQAAADRLAAQAMQQSRETQVAQIQASDQARDLLDVPMDVAEVDLAVQDEEAVDPDTGRRRPVRATFMSNRPSGSGIRIN